MNLKLLFIASFTILFASACYAQMGCTDPYATNYDANATINDGSCVYPVTHDTPALRTQLAMALTESSGLVWDNGKLWTHNDSGNPATFFSIDTSDGHVLQKVYVDNYFNDDWEDITADADYIYLGDFGNNNGDRTNLKVLKIAKTDINADTVHVNAQAIFFSYSDQTSFTSNPLTNFDCEAMISVGDSLYVFTKDRGDNKTRVYKMPKTPGTYSLNPYANYNVGGILTAASYNAATHEIVLLGYTLLKTKSFLWFLNDYNGDMFFTGNKRRIEIGGNSEWQTEGIAFLSADRYFISNETATVNASLFIGDKSWMGNLGLGKAQKKNAVIVNPNPFTGSIYISNIVATTPYSVKDVTGKQVAQGVVGPGNNSIKLDAIRPGTYMLELALASGQALIQEIVKQ